MANMSYCRFQNTSNDLADCVNVIEDAIDEGMSIDAFLEGMSSEEQRAFRRLVDLADKLQGAVEALENNMDEVDYED